MNGVTVLARNENERPSYAACVHASKSTRQAMYSLLHESKLEYWLRNTWDTFDQVASQVVLSLGVLPRQQLHISHSVSDAALYYCAQPVLAHIVQCIEYCTSCEQLAWCVVLLAQSRLGGRINECYWNKVSGD